MVEDLAAARGQFVRAATCAAHTVALRGIPIRVNSCSFVVSQNLREMDRLDALLLLVRQALNLHQTT